MSRRLGLGPVVTLAAIIAAAPAAEAHQTSVKPVTLAVDGARVTVEVRAGIGDVAEMLGLAGDQVPTTGQLWTGRSVIADQVTRWVVLSTAGSPCLTKPADLSLDQADQRFLMVRWSAECPIAVAALRVDFVHLFALDPTQSVVLRLTAPGAADHETIVSLADSPIEIALGESGGSLAFIRHGISHILHGCDHVAFVLALLLVVILARAPTGWQLRPVGSALRSTAMIVTSFTVAHSLTLIAASLGWVSLPARPVESVIALSIAYTALENIVRPDVRWRFLLTFGFGLAHGLGFAGVLADLLPDEDLLLPLLAFNVGVELGQLAIVVVTIPALAAICRLIGPNRYRRVLMPVASVLLAILGAIWLVERVFEISLIGVCG